MDEEVEKLRGPREDSPLYPHWKVKPAADKVDTGALLADIKAQIERYVATLGKRSIVPAVFTMFAWLHKDATHSPLLVATSPEPDSGKTTLVLLLMFMVRRGLSTVGITGPVLFRSIEKWAPSIVIDEADTVMENNDDVRTVVNSGWTRNASVLRCDPDTHEPRPYSTFAAKILAMKKEHGRIALRDTTLSRSIILELKRKTAAESVEDFDHYDREEFAQPSGRRLSGRRAIRLPDSETWQLQCGKTNPVRDRSMSPTWPRTTTNCTIDGVDHELVEPEHRSLDAGVVSLVAQLGGALLGVGERGEEKRKSRAIASG